MRDPKRIGRILSLLNRAWARNPDLRLGQLILDAAALSGWTGYDPFFIEDEFIEEGLQHLVELDVP